MEIWSRRLEVPEGSVLAICTPEEMIFAEFGSRVAICTPGRVIFADKARRLRARNMHSRRSDLCRARSMVP